jgi:hypothetical protein
MPTGYNPQVLETETTNFCSRYVNKLLMQFCDPQLVCSHLVELVTKSQETTSFHSSSVTDLALAPATQVVYNRNLAFFSIYPASDNCNAYEY